MTAELRAHLRRLISGYQLSQAIFAAAELRIPDALRAGPLDCRRLATLLRVDEAALTRLMRALAENDIFRATPGGAYANTELSALLVSTGEQSLHARALLAGQDFVWRSWGRLTEAVRTGESVFAALFDDDFFDYLDNHPAERALFQTALAGGSADRAEALELVDLTDADRCVDVGGGHGHLLAAVLGRHRHLRGVLFDRPGVLPEADRVLTGHGVRDRCELVAGDFHQAVHAGADVYLLSQILHDWDDAAALRILRNCRAALTGGGRLLVIERLTGPARAGRLSDLNMLLLLGGRERTLEQYGSLLGDAGLRLHATHRTAGGWAVMEASPR